MMKRILVISSLVLSLGPGCASEQAVRFQDPDFDLILSIEDKPPPCGCIEQAIRFGGTIHYDDTQGVWRKKDGSEVDLSEQAETEYPSYPGDTIVRLGPNLSYEATVAAFASLGDAGICGFQHVEPPIETPVEVYSEPGPDGENLIDTHLYTYRSKTDVKMSCRPGMDPEPTADGYSRNSELFKHHAY